MISARTGDILESRMQTITNTVNCVGVMGKGLALEFKRHFPDMFRDYAERCRKGAVVPGKPYTYRDMLGVTILNFPTRRHWREASRLAHARQFNSIGSISISPRDKSPTRSRWYQMMSIQCRSSPSFEGLI